MYRISSIRTNPLCATASRLLAVEDKKRGTQSKKDRLSHLLQGQKMFKHKIYINQKCMYIFY